MIDVDEDAQGILSYTIGVRSLVADGTHTRGVSVGSAGKKAVRQPAVCSFPVRNTGQAGAGAPVHPEDVSAHVTSDVYRLSASATGTGWSAQLKNALATARFGETITIPVYVTRANQSSGTTTVTLTATSESDPSKSSSGTCAVKR